MSEPMTDEELKHLQSVPRLLHEIRQLRAEVERLEDAAEQAGENYTHEHFEREKDRKAMEEALPVLRAAMNHGPSEHRARASVRASHIAKRLEAGDE